MPFCGFGNVLSAYFCVTFLAIYNAVTASSGNAGGGNFIFTNRLSVLMTFCGLGNNKLSAHFLIAFLAIHHAVITAGGCAGCRYLIFNNG